MTPNKHMQRAGRHKVLGRGRVSLVPRSAPRARVLTGQPAGADVDRYAALALSARSVVQSILVAVSCFAATAFASDVSPDCGKGARIARLANISEYYPRYTDCPRGPFRVEVKILVRASGKSSSVLSIDMKEPGPSSEKCIRDLVGDLVSEGLRFIPPQADCTYTLRVRAVTGKE